MAERTPAEQLARAVLLPHLVGCAAGLVVLALGVGGLDPQWQDAPVNLATAISMGDLGQAVRRVEQGEDPTRIELVPGGDPDDPLVPMTPLHAAVVNGELAMVRAIVERGVPIDTAERRALACIATTREAPEIAEFLIGRVPGAEDCAGAGEDRP